MCSRGEFAPKGTPARYRPDLALEPRHLAAELVLDHAAQSVTGSVTTTFVARRSDQRSLVLNAVDFSEVHVADLEGHACEWSYDGEQIAVTYAQAPAQGQERRLKVSYQVVNPLNGIHFSSREGTRYLCTDHETERARYWLPCVDHPAARTTLELTLRAEGGFKILANGLLQGEESHDDGTKTWRWALDYPCPSYLICIAGGELVRAEGGVHVTPDGREVEVAAFAPPPYTPEQLERSFGKTKDMIDWLSAKLDAPFPFPKYYQVAIPGIGGAMENISLVTWDDAFVLDEVLEREWGPLAERINVHELAHSYFGDAIVMEDFAHAWLKESWATYVETLWVEDHESRDEFLLVLDEDAEAYMGEVDDRYARPIVTRSYQSAWDLFDDHLYPGGAWRLHMLRKRLGEGPFWQGVRAYVARYSRRLVETSDFRRCLEEAGGVSLSRFFDEWVHSPGYPRLEVAFDHDAERGEVRLEFEQKQVDRAKGIGTFSFPLVIDLERAPGEWTRHRVQIERAREALVIPVKGRPLQVVIDPESDVLKRLIFDPGKDLLERSLGEGPLPARLHAARTLAKSGRRVAIQAVEKAFQSEESWGVRRAMAKALAKAKTQYAIDALARLLVKEEEPRVQFALAAACGKFRDPALAAALREHLARPDLAYRARGEAYAALGAQRTLGESAEDRALLEEGAQDKSWWGHVRRGALIGLARSRDPRALALVAERFRRPEVDQVRRAILSPWAAATSFGDSSARLQALERLNDLTRDPIYGVRKAVAAALVALGERRGVSALESIGPTLTHQDRPDLERKRKRLLRKTDSAKEAKALQKRVDELEAKQRKLERRLESLGARAVAQGGSAPRPTQ